MEFDVLPLLIKQLKEVFHLPVYDEPIQQGLDTPCFIVQAKLIKRERLMNDNDRQMFFCIVHYYTKEVDNLRSEYQVIKEKLCSHAFRYLGGQYHINSLEIDDDSDVLVATFTVQRLVRWTEDITPMQTIEASEVQVKDEKV